MVPDTSSTSSVSSLLARYRSVRQASMQICSPLSAEDLMVQSLPEASPGKWHLAHTSWFFETLVLSEFDAAYRPLYPDFRWLFNSYYNSISEQPAKRLRSTFSRPSLEAVVVYRSHVDAAIERLLERPLDEEAARRIVLGIAHEEQHQELIFTDIKHALFTNPLQPAYLETVPASSGTVMAPPMEWAGFKGGLAEVGFDPGSAEMFAYDNESPRHAVYLEPFRIATRLVTCAEYLAFIDQNGYNRPELWLSDGWAAVRAEGWQAPLCWYRDSSTESGWSIYTLHGFIPLEDLSETPVCHVSLYEADAYARWSACRLPTEFEWEHAALSLSMLRKETDSPPANLLETGSLHPVPARPLTSLQQMYGDTWEWTASPYTGYPGYRPQTGALGEYNSKFMSSQMVLRGGSCVTPAAHIRPTYRNFWAPATRYQFSGIRLAQEVDR